MKEVSVIIVNYRTTMLARQCIASVALHTRVDYELILVDNSVGGEDLTIITNDFPFVRLLCPAENLGFGKACNLAVQQARGRFLLLLNPDSTLMNDAVGHFLEFHKKYNLQLLIGCLGGILTSPDHNDIHSYEQFPTAGIYLVRKLQSMARRLFCVTGKDTTTQKVYTPDHYARVDYITGASLFLSRETFDMSGGFDPRFFMYFEETDLQYRLSKRGLYSYVIKGPEVVHLGGKSAASSAHVRTMYRESLLLYIKKHNSPIRFSLFRVIWSLLDIKTTWQKQKSTVKKRNAGNGV